MTRSFSVFAAFGAAFAWKDPGDGFMLRMLSADSGALCLDGSPGGYYSRPGSDASTFIIELEGGGWCVSLEDCYGRSKTAIGSSKSWPASGSPGMDGGSHGLFSNNCTINPHFCNSNMIHMNYCDGASFAGNVTEPAYYNNVTQYYRGRVILDETLRQLLAVEGLNKASRVILKGCSAGGLATYLHVDHVSALLRAAVPGLTVVGLPDAGTFLDHATYSGPSIYTPQMQWVTTQQQVAQPGSVNDACLAAYSPADAWHCFMAQYTLPHIVTPIFVAQDLDDSWQLANIAYLPCSPAANKANGCNATELAYLNQYRLDTLSALSPVLQNPACGGFFTACVQHCHSNIDACWDKAVVAGQNMADTFWAWYDNTVNGTPLPPGVRTLVVDSTFGSNPTCTSACSPYR